MIRAGVGLLAAAAVLSACSPAAVLFPPDLYAFDTGDTGHTGAPVALDRSTLGCTGDGTGWLAVVDTLGDSASASLALYVPESVTGGPPTWETHPLSRNGGEADGTWARYVAGPLEAGVSTPESGVSTALPCPHPADPDGTDPGTPSWGVVLLGFSAEALDCAGFGPQGAGVVDVLECGS
jgi:hypothetical protein